MARPTRPLKLDRLETRITPAGQLDPTFGAGATGLAVFPFAQDGFTQFATADSAVQADGKIVVVGNVANGNVTEVGVMRLERDGKTLDATFGTSGRLHFGVNGDSAGGVAIDGGKIVISGGKSGTPVGEEFVARLNADGTPDTTFNNTGLVPGQLILPAGPFQGNGADVAVRAGGAYVVLGSVGSLGMDNFGNLTGDVSLAVTQVTAGGVIDTAFGTAGTAGDRLSAQIDLHPELQPGRSASSPERRHREQCGSRCRYRHRRHQLHRQAHRRRPTLVRRIGRYHVRRRRHRAGADDGRRADRYDEVPPIHAGRRGRDRRHRPHHPSRHHDRLRHANDHSSQRRRRRASGRGRDARPVVLDRRESPRSISRTRVPISAAP